MVKKSFFFSIAFILLVKASPFYAMLTNLADALHQLSMLKTPPQTKETLKQKPKQKEKEKKEKKKKKHVQNATNQIIKAMTEFCPESKKEIWKKIVKKNESYIGQDPDLQLSAQEVFIRLVFYNFASPNDVLTGSNKIEETNYLSFINRNVMQPKKENQKTVDFTFERKEEFLEKMWTIIEAFAKNTNGIRSLIYGLNFIKDPSLCNKKTPCIVIGYDKNNKAKLINALAALFPEISPVKEEKKIKKEESKKEEKTKPISVDQLLENLKKKKLTGFTVTEKEDNSFLEELLGSYHSKGIKVWQIYNQQTKTKSKKALIIPCNKKSFLPLVTEFITLLEKNTDLQNAINLVWIPKNITTQPFIAIISPNRKKTEKLLKPLLEKALEDIISQSLPSTFEKENIKIFGYSALNRYFGKKSTDSLSYWKLNKKNIKENRHYKSLLISCKQDHMLCIQELMNLLAKDSGFKNAILIAYISLDTTQCEEDKTPFILIRAAIENDIETIKNILKNNTIYIKKIIDAKEQTEAKEEYKKEQEKLKKLPKSQEQKIFFETIIGMAETNFKANKQAIEDAASFEKNKENKEILTLKNLKTKQKYQAGYFEQISIEQLKKQTENLKDKNGGSFSVIQGIETSTHQNVKDKVDVAALQADPKNNDAVFQVASNFNGLEFTSSAGYQMQDVTAYPKDTTQGPAASVSAAPGTILRQYYVFRNNKNLNNPIAWAQYNEECCSGRNPKEHQINFLDNKGVNLTTKNGYVQLEKSLNDSHDYTKVKIGWQGDTQVTFGGTDLSIQNTRHKLVPTNPKQIIHQVFTAAADLQGENNFEDETKKEKAEKIAKELLNVAYEGTIRAAAVHGKKKVFLTLVGGGVFGNDLPWIIDAIEKQFPLIKQFDLDVTLVIFDGRGLSSNYNNQKTLKKKLKEMTEKLKGHYIEYSS